MTVRLVDEQPCPTCGGKGRVPRPNHEGLTKDCTSCGGMGVRVSPVSCAGCKWYDDGTCYELCVVTDTHNWYQSVEPDFGCTRWTAKEGTDGR